MTRQEQRLIEALNAFKRAVSALDIAIDYGHHELLDERVLDIIRECVPLFSWCMQFDEVEL